MSPETILDIVKDARRRRPDARFVLCTVPKSWPDTSFGQKVQVVGRLVGRYVGRSPHGSLVDVHLSDAEIWARDQQRRSR